VVSRAAAWRAAPVSGGQSRAASRGASDAGGAAAADRRGFEGLVRFGGASSSVTHRHFLGSLPGTAVIKPSGDLASGGPSPANASAR
jgi:hypothetical protein